MFADMQIEERMIRNESCPLSFGVSLSGQFSSFHNCKWSGQNSLTSVQVHTLGNLETSHSDLILDTKERPCS